MSATAGLLGRVGPAGREFGFPLLGRLLVAVSAVACGLAGWAMVRSWDAYSSPVLVVAAWLVTVATVPIAVRRILLTRAVTPVTMAGVVSAVLVVDVVVPTLLDPALRTTPAAWNWRSGAVLACVFSAYRPPRDVGLLAGAHAAVAVAFAVAAGGTTPTAVVVLAMICAAPPLIAATYLARYTESLLNRRTAVDLHTRTTALRAAEQAQRQSVLDEVASIRSRIIDLLESVGDGQRPPAGADVRQEARDLSAALRRELDETRSRGWVAAGGTPDGGPPVDVLGPASLLDDDARASVAALVELLRRHQDLRQITVTVTAAGPDGATPADGGGSAAGSSAAVDVTVVGSGPGSAEAFGDPAVVAVAEGLNTTVWHDEEAGHVVVETRLGR